MFNVNFYGRNTKSAFLKIFVFVILKQFKDVKNSGVTRKRRHASENVFCRE